MLLEQLADENAAARVHAMNGTVDDTARCGIGLGDPGRAPTQTQTPRRPVE
jgi:hypothetical protein